MISLKYVITISLILLSMCFNHLCRLNEVTVGIKAACNTKKGDYSTMIKHSSTSFRVLRIASFGWDRYSILPPTSKSILTNPFLSFDAMLIAKKLENGHKFLLLHQNPLAGKIFGSNTTEISRANFLCKIFPISWFYVHKNFIK